MERIIARGVPVPGIMYGTAWKEARTEALVREALAAGFRAFDSANQRKHYFEAGVGAALGDSGVARAELFLQTKFTYQRGQDHRLPYDPGAPLGDQVAQSFASSLQHLRTTRLDAYVLHGPWAGAGWSAQDVEVWSAMESLHRDGRTALLGISNVSLAQLTTLCERAAVAPAFVQNRCYARERWDGEVRAFCSRNAIVYQGFSLLTANTRELGTAEVRAVAQRLGATVPQLVFRFARAIGMLPLTGTTDPQHMREDLASGALPLGEREIELLLDIGRTARS